MFSPWLKFYEDFYLSKNKVFSEKERKSSDLVQYLSDVVLPAPLFRARYNTTDDYFFVDLHCHRANSVFLWVHDVKEV